MIPNNTTLKEFVGILSYQVGMLEFFRSKISDERYKDDQFANRTYLKIYLPMDVVFWCICDVSWTLPRPIAFAPNHLLEVKIRREYDVFCTTLTFLRLIDKTCGIRLITFFCLQIKSFCTTYYKSSKCNHF